MKNIELVKRLVKLQILCIRYVERNTTLRIKTHRDMDRILMKNMFTCDYNNAIENLNKIIKRYCIKSKYLVKECMSLKKDIQNSPIKNLRFGLEPQRKFTEEEQELDTLLLKRRFFMINEMVSIKDISEMLCISESAVKQACQQERLLNTKKIGNSWMVHIPECRAYWNIPDTNEKNLYKDYIY